MRPLRLLSVRADVLPPDAAGLAALIVDAAADIACVHGAPSLLRWRSKCAALARRSGMVVLGGGRTAGGTLLLATLGVDERARHDVALGHPLAPRPAGAVVVVLRHLGRELVVAGAGLSSGSAGGTQAEALCTALDGLVPGRPPTLVCAAGADRPGTPAWRVLGAGRTDVGNGVFADARLTIGTVEEFGPRGPAAGLGPEDRPLRVEITP